MTKVTAWHGDPALKAYAVERMRQHASVDRLIRGAYIAGKSDEDWQGCFHGCLTVEKIAEELEIQPLQVRLDDWHRETERIWGIPAAVGELLDALYEESSSPPGELAVAILDAIPVGADLTPVVIDRLMLDLLKDPQHGARAVTGVGSPARAAVENVAELYRRRLNGIDPPASEWEVAEGFADHVATTTHDYTVSNATDAASTAAYTARHPGDARYVVIRAERAHAGSVGWWPWWEAAVLDRLRECEPSPNNGPTAEVAA